MLKELATALDTETLAADPALPYYDGLVATVSSAQAALSAATDLLGDAAIEITNGAYVEASPLVALAREHGDDVARSIDGLRSAPAVLAATAASDARVLPGVILLDWETPLPDPVAGAVQPVWAMGASASGAILVGQRVLLNDVAVQDPAFATTVGEHHLGATATLDRVAVGATVRVSKTYALVSPIVARDLLFLKSWYPGLIEEVPSCAGACGCAECVIPSVALDADVVPPPVGFCDVAMCPLDFTVSEKFGMVAADYGVHRLPLDPGECEDPFRACFDADVASFQLGIYKQAHEILLDYHASVVVTARTFVPKHLSADADELSALLAFHVDAARTPLQLDEYPPAMFREGGQGSSVRPVTPRDNRGAGACIGNQCRGLPDGTRVRIVVE